MTNKIDASELKKIVKELAYAFWGSGNIFPKFVEPRVNALLQALDELEALRAELKNWREIKTLFDQTSDDNAYLRHQVTALDHELDALKAECDTLKAERDTLKVEKDGLVEVLTLAQNALAQCKPDRGYAQQHTNAAIMINRAIGETQ